MKDFLLLHLLYESEHCNEEDGAVRSGRSQTWWEMWDQQACATSLQRNAVPACCNFQIVLRILKLLFTQQNQNFILWCCGKKLFPVLLKRVAHSYSTPPYLWEIFKIWEWMLDRKSLTAWFSSYENQLCKKKSFGSFVSGSQHRAGARQMQ